MIKILFLIRSKFYKLCPCDLREYIYTKKPGDEVILDVLRNRKNLTIKIKLSKK